MNIMAKRNDVPGPPGWFGLRNFIRFVREPLEFLTQLRERHGDLVGMRALGAPWYLINHPDDIEELLVRRASSIGRDEFVEVLQRVLGMGLLTSEGELWKRQRKLMAKAFTPKRIRTYAQTMARVTDRSLDWRHGQQLNLHEEAARISMQVVAGVLFGSSLSPRDVDTVHASMRVMFEYATNSPEAILKLPSWLPTRRNRGLARAIENFDTIIYGIIDARRRGPERDDLLATLIQAVDEEGSGMSDEQMRDEFIALFVAGHETVSLAIAHTLYLLCTHAEIEQRVVRELETVLDGRLPSFADIGRLEYLGRVVKEGMRLYPSGWISGREVREPIELRGVTLPKGAQLLLSQWVVQRDPRWFPDPERFDPERWAPERAKQRPRYAYFPFGGGPHVCIGTHFATMETTLILAIILQRYQIALAPGQRLEFSPSATLRPKGEGLRAEVRERDGALESRPAALEITAA